jgi:signal transduction histidine kinase
MRITPRDLDTFLSLLQESEEDLMARILFYAERQDYTKYTSTLKEAWRLSIEGLSSSMIEGLRLSDQVPELGPDENFIDDPGAKFGMVEARRHRARGVNLAMFLGLMKYYRQAYLDVLRSASVFEQPATIGLFIQRFFDRTELAYCTEWAGIDPEAQIKELSRSNLHLANEKNKYLTLFESLSSPVILCDVDGRVDNYNNVAGQLLFDDATPGSHYYAEKRRDLSPLDLQQELMRLTIESKDQLVVEKTYITSAGARTYDVRIERMLDVSRKFSGYTLLFNDITERRQWAEQLKQINQRQQQLIDDLKRTREQLVQSEKLAAIGQLAAGVAHEINNPVGFCASNVRTLGNYVDELLGLIDAYDELIEGDGALKALRARLDALCEDVELDYLKDDSVALITETLDGLERIRVIVSDLKSYSRASDKQWVELDINHEIESTLHIVWNELKYHTEVVLELDDLPLVQGVPNQLGQVIMNLLINAAQAIEDKGTIIVRSGQCEGGVWFEVHDTGRGIETQQIKHLFEPFFTTKPVGQGTGLGLSVSHGIVEKHHGEIIVESSLGKGSLFRVCLPLRQDMDEAQRLGLQRQCKKLNSADGVKRRDVTDLDEALPGVVEEN